MNTSLINDIPHVSQTHWANIPPLLRPNLEHLYHKRAMRLRHLAKQHALSDYFLFLARLVEAQAIFLAQEPLEPIWQDTRPLSPHTIPLDPASFPRSDYWQRALKALLKAGLPHAPERAQKTINALYVCSPAELERLATELLTGKWHQINSDRALFLWLALSLYWVQLAQYYPHKSLVTVTAETTLCPLCHSLPVASVIQIGMHSGLRYLHCSLCESQWHYVRSQCSCCGKSQHLDYWSLESEHDAVKAESCGDCQSYLKVLYQEKSADLEILADELASLYLDIQLEQRQLAKSGLNPLLFPGGINNQ